VKIAESMRIPSNLKLLSQWTPDERGKRGFYCDKQGKRVVTVLNHMLKGLWGEGGSRGIRKKLKYKAQLICNIKIDKMIVGSI